MRRDHLRDEKDLFLFFAYPKSLKWLVLGLLVGGWAIGLPSTILAQSPARMKRLPPPPLPVPNTPIPSSDSVSNSVVPVKVIRPVAVPSPSPIAPQDVPREYTFQAPSSQEQPNPNFPSSQTPHPPITPRVTPAEAAIATTQLYRVEVQGTDETLLAQVKSVEPLAAVWQNQGVIYSGMFTHPDQAQERVRLLEQKGLTVKITPISREINPYTRIER